jgi:hypothetical protein
MQGACRIARSLCSLAGAPGKPELVKWGLHDVACYQAGTRPSPSVPACLGGDMSRSRHASLSTVHAPPVHVYLPAQACHLASHRCRLSVTAKVLQPVRRCRAGCSVRGCRAAVGAVHARASCTCTHVSDTAAAGRPTTAARLCAQLQALWRVVLALSLRGHWWRFYFLGTRSMRKGQRGARARDMQLQEHSTAAEGMISVVDADLDKNCKRVYFLTDVSEEKRNSRTACAL